MLRFRTALVAFFAFAAVPAATFAQTTGATVELPSNTSSRAGAVTLAQASGAAAEAASARPSSPVALDGLYLRAGFVLDRSKRTRFTDEDCSSTSPGPLALYGCGAGIDGAPLSSLGDFGTMAGFELGLGHVTSSALRLEALVQYLPSFSFEGRANFVRTPGRQAVSADMSSLTAMLAAYLDLPALGLPRVGPMIPFIGSGAGLSRIRIGDTRMDFPELNQRTVVPGGKHTGFAWMVTAGVALPVWEKVTLDVAWRYTDHGAVRTDRADGVVYREGRPPLVLDLAPTRADLRGHGFTVSLRYAF